MVWIHGWLLSSRAIHRVVVVRPGNGTTPESTLQGYSSLVQTGECSADCLQGASVQCNAGPDAAVRGCPVKSQSRVRASTRLECRVEPPGQWGPRHLHDTSPNKYLARRPRLDNPRSLTVITVGQSVCRPRLFSPFYLAYARDLQRAE